MEILKGATCTGFICFMLATCGIEAKSILPSCPSGTFLQLGEMGAQDECLPCSADQYNHLKNHRLTHCFPCAQFDEQSPYQEALISHCAPHKNAVIQCAQGYEFDPTDPRFPCQASTLPREPVHGQVKEQTSSRTRDAITNLDLHYNKTDLQPQNKSTTAKDDRVESDGSKTETDKGPDKASDHDRFPTTSVIVSAVFGTLILVLFVLALVRGLCRSFRVNPTPETEGKQKPLLPES